MGLGDYNPSDGVWQIATVVVSVNGLILFTMAITYIVPVERAADAVRQLAAYLKRLAATPEDLVLRSWDGDSFRASDDHFVALTPMIDGTAQQYLACPILHYFHSPEVDTSLCVRPALGTRGNDG